MISIKLLVLLIAFTTAVLVISGIFLFLPKSTDSVIYEDGPELRNGISFVLEEGGESKFKWNQTEEALIVSSVSEDYIEITLKGNLTAQEEITNVKINLGQTRRFDLDRDEKEDILVRLENITDGKAYLYLRDVCIEDWICTDWNSCVNNNQTRECTERNSCGTEESKPEEVQSCVLSCYEQGGKICGNTGVCNGTIMDSTEGDCCLGRCDIKKLEFISCGTNIDCLITASETCNPSNLTYSSSMTNGTWSQTANSYYKIRELEGDKCKFYKEILSNDGGFTDSKKQALIAEGKTEGEITQMEEGISSSVIGETGICRFSVYALKERITELKNGNVFITADELGDYECSGELVWIN